MEIPFFGHKEQETSPAIAAPTAVMEHPSADAEAEAASEAAFNAIEPRSETDGSVVINAPVASSEPAEQTAATEPTAEAAPVTELPTVQPVAEAESQSDTNQQISV